MHPALKYESSLFLSRFSVLLQSMHSHKIRHEAPTEMHIELSKIAIPLIFMILITLLWLSIVLFWQHVVTRSVQQKIKAPVKVNPFFCVFAFWLFRTVVHWSGNIWQNKLQALWILDILWQALFSDKMKMYIVEGTQMPYYFSRINLRFLFKCVFFSVSRP